MDTSSSKRALAYLQGQCQDLQAIMAKVKQLEILNQKVSVYLNPKIMQYCHIANLLEHRLIMIAANSTIATELRFQTSDLLRKFKHDPILQDIKGIQCKVSPDLVKSEAKPIQRQSRKMQLLSKETAEIIRSSAELLDDANLREVMLRIAKHTTP